MADVGAVAQRLSPVMGSSNPGAKPFEPSKPVLVRMMEVHKSLGNTGDAASHYILDRIQGKRAELQVWCKKHMDHLIEVSKRTLLEHTWSTLKTVAESFISVFSFVMGGYLLANGDATAGNFLITTGVFNILQSVFARQGMWDWITETLAEKHEASRDRLKLALPIIISTLSLAFSIAGSRFSATMQPTDLVVRLEKAREFIAIGAQGMSSYLTICKSWEEAKLPSLQAELKSHEQNIDLLARLLDTCIKESRRMKSMIKQTAQKMMQRATNISEKV